MMNSHHYFKIIIMMLTWLGYSLLWLFGWKPLTLDNITSLRKYHRCVIIFSHTTYWDFFIFLMYALTETSLWHHTRTVMSAYYYYKVKWFFKPLGVIPATPRNEHGKGFIKQTVDDLQKINTFYLLISPEGTVSKAPWKSGYYALAKELQCPIRVAGADYEKKCIWLGDPHLEIESKTRDQIEPELQKEMFSIAPLYPETSYTSVRPHDSTKLSLIDWMHLLNVSSWCVFLIWTLSWKWIYSFLEWSLIGVGIYRCQYQSNILLVLFILTWGIKIKIKDIFLHMAFRSLITELLYQKEYPYGLFIVIILWMILL